MNEEELFLRGLEIPSQAEREAFLDRACGANKELRRKVAALLRAYDGAGTFLEHPFLSIPKPSHTPQQADTTSLHPDNRGAGATKAATFPDVPGYEILSELGCGGMGVVYKARQLRANRLVALKCLSAGCLAGETERERFRREAEALALLQHPGIVQIFEVGEYRGTLYYSLELCEGGSLDQWCDGRPLLPRQATELVVALAAAVQSAHEAKVLHRDLKPGNVLLVRRPAENSLAETPSGSAPVSPGDIKVADFGLAKRLDDVTRTQTGLVVGTPSYLAPEAAGGSKVGPAADIYALGAILYELLTGKPPFRGTTDIETVLQVLQSDPVPPRQLRRGLPRDLETICLKCLHKEPTRRYGTARELGEDLQRFMNGKPIHARPVGQIERGWRWCRRNPALAGLLVLLFLLVFASGVWFQRDRAEQAQRLARSEESVRLSVGKGRETLDGLRSRLAARGGVRELLENPGEWEREIEAAAASLQRARDFRSSADTDIDEQLLTEIESLSTAIDRAGADRTFAIELERIWLEKATPVASGMTSATAARDYPLAFQRAGLPVREDDEAGLASQVRNSAIRERLLAALADWGGVAADQGDTGLSARLLRVVQKISDDPWWDRLCDPVAWRRPDVLAALVEQLLSEPDALRNLPPTLLVVVGQRLPARSDLAETWLRASQVYHPTDFWVNLTLGNVLSARGSREAVGYYRAALARRPGAVVYTNLAAALLAQGEIDEAAAAARKAISLSPNFAPAYVNLGCVRFTWDDLKGAVSNFKRALELDQNASAAHFNLGRVLQVQGDVEGAAGLFRRAIEINPRDAGAHALLGTLQAQQNETVKAIANLRRAVELDPGLQEAWYNLGTALYHKGDWTGAVASLREAVKLDPKHIRSRVNLGAALKQARELDDAVANLREAVKIDPDFAMAHFTLGNTLHTQRKLAEAEEALSKAVALAPTNGEFQFRLGWVLMDRGRFDDAAEATRRALSLSPPGHPYRAATQWQADKCKQLSVLEKKLPLVLGGEAVPAAERAAMAYLCLRYKGRYLDATALFKDAFTAEPKLADDWQRSPRYNAACGAVLAAAGQGEGVGDLDRERIAELRRQGFEWLRAALAAREKLVSSSSNAEAVRKQLELWKTDPDLQTVREAKDLAQLGTEEQQEWRHFWSDVEQLHAKLGTTTSTEQKNR